jgi:hypothetical protein
MEILRFEEAAPVAPKRKKSSKGYLTAGFVAALFGIGTALASATTEIAINDGGGISLGQGVTLATACDTEIDITPITTMTLKEDPISKVDVPTFFLTELEVSKIDTEEATAATDSLAEVTGCGTKYFDIQIFDPSTDTAYECGAAANQLHGVTIDHDGTGIPTIICDVNTLRFQVLKESVDRKYTISFDEAPSSISYITLVTRNNA